MRLRDVAGDGQPQARAAAVAVAGGLEAVERLEHPFQLLRGNAGTAVAHPDRDHRPILDQDVGARAEGGGVGHQIGETALERLRLGRQGLHDVAGEGHLPPHVGELLAHLVEQRVQVEGGRRLAVLDAAEQRQRLADHGLHLVELAADALLHGRIVECLDLQPQPRQRGLQVMRHRGQHPGATVEVAPQAVLHGVEGACRLAQLARTALAQLRRARIAANAVCGARQLRQRPGDVACRDVQHGHQDQQQQHQVGEQMPRERCPLRQARHPEQQRRAVRQMHAHVVAARTALVGRELVRFEERHRHRDRRRRGLRCRAHLDRVRRAERAVHLILQGALEIRQQRQAHEAALPRASRVPVSPRGRVRQVQRLGRRRQPAERRGTLGAVQRLQHEGGLGDAARPLAQAPLQHEALALLGDEQQARRLRHQHRRHRCREQPAEQRLWPRGQAHRLSPHAQSLTTTTPTT